MVCFFAKPDDKWSHPTLYKNYTKETKDLLTKNHISADLWKIESKCKAPRGTPYINPSATSDGKFAVDVEYALPDYDISTSLTFKNNKDVVGKASFKQHGHTADVSVDQRGDYELNHEWAFRKYIATHLKLVAEEIQCGVGAKVHPNIQFGFGTTYGFRNFNNNSKNNKKLNKWTASCRLEQKGGSILSFRINNECNALTIAAMAPVKINRWSMTAAFDVTVEKNKNYNGTVGCETKCPLVPSNRIAVRVNKAKEINVSYVAKLTDAWTATLTFDKNMKTGVAFMHS